MKKDIVKLNTLNTKNIKSFVQEHKMLIAALGGITVGIGLAALLGNKKAKHFTFPGKYTC